MNTINLTDFLKTSTQKQAAKVMGVTQGAVSKMINNGKTVYLVFDEAGDIDHWYPFIPRVPKQSKQQAATG